MKQRNRVFYVGMIATDAYGESVGEKTYAGAAANKMISVAGAMRSVGHRAIIVSIPSIGARAKRAFYPPVLTVEGGTPAVFLATFKSRYLRKIFGPFFLAAFALRRISAGDTVILYNHAVEYILALAMLRLMKVNVVQDIEDAPADDEKGWQGWLNRVCFATTFRLTNRRKMVVADHVARELKLDDYVVVRGVASDDTGASRNADARKWEDLQTGGDLKLHFGGTLVHDTGVDVFCQGVELLAWDDCRLHRRVVFKVTGVGELEKIRSLQNRIHASAKVHLELLPELSKAGYVALIDMCHGSLSLRRPKSAMAKTTFPSKVIEITAAGLALVSTRLGDVASLFNDESAFFLTEDDPVELADIIVGMMDDPVRVERVAKTGRDVCNRTFSTKAVGEEIGRLL